MGYFFRFLLLGVLIYLIVWFFASLLKDSRKKREAEKKEMVRCVHCKTFLPKPEAVSHKGQYFCNDEHHQAAKDKEPPS